MKKLVVVLAGLMMMMFSSNLNALNVNNTVKGQIINNTDNAPVRGAGIILKDNDNLIGTITDEDGNFILLNVSAGVHYIQVKQQGFNDKIIKVNVPANKDATVNVTLEKTITEPANFTEEDNHTDNRSFYQLFANPQINFNLLNFMNINF